MIINTVEKAVTKLPQIQLDSGFSPGNILDMVLAGGSSQTLYNLDEGAHQRAVKFLCCETWSYPNYPLSGGFVQEDDKGRPYFRGGTSSFRSNKYWNEFLGTLALAGVHFPGTVIRTARGNEGTLADMADAAMAVCTDNDQDPGWSLMLYSVYPGVTEKWINEDGETWSVERLLESAVSLPYGYGACFGTHVLQGISFAVSRYCMDQDIEPSRLDGTWGRAWQYVQGALALMSRNQREDGSMDRCWFRGRALPSTARECAETIKEIWLRRTKYAQGIVYPSGHCLSAVSPVFDFLDSDRSWLENCCYVLAQTVDLEWSNLTQDIHSLSHAVYALKQTGM